MLRASSPSRRMSVSNMSVARAPEELVDNISLKTLGAGIVSHTGFVLLGIDVGKDLLINRHELCRIFSDPQIMVRHDPKVP